MTENSIHILLIEDNADDVVLFKRMLSAGKNASFDIHNFDRLDEALSALIVHQFDVILLDLTLPASQGLETFTQVHARASDIPIIVLTGLADEELAILSVRLGAQDYLVKDQVNHHLLIRSIRYAIERKRTEDKMITYQKQLRSLASQLAMAEERERRRIATELHDHIGQNLAISRIKLGLLRESASSTKFDPPLEEIQKLIEETIRYTRTLTFELSPPLLYEFGFEAAVEWLSERIRDQYNLRVEIEKNMPTQPLNDEISVLLFQAVRELLYNVVKHANTPQAFLAIGKDNQFIRVTVQDHGKGFDLSQAYPNAAQPSSFGLFNIRERLKHFGGKMEIQSQPGQGTCVTLLAPLHQERTLSQAQNSSLPDQA